MSILDFPIISASYASHYMGLNKLYRPVFLASLFRQQIDFVGSKADISLFIKVTSASTLYILIYVDDIIIIGSSSAHIDELINHLQSSFAIKDMSSLHYFIGIEVIHSYVGLFLSQRKYITDLLRTAKLDDQIGFNSIANQHPINTICCLQN